MRESAFPDDAGRRRDVESESLFEPLETYGESRDRRVVCPVAGHPGEVLGAAHDAAREVHAPGVGGGIEGDRLEGNLELRRPAPLETACRDVENAVPVPIGLTDVAIEAVIAHAIGIDAEVVSTAPLVEWIDHHKEAIVVPHLIVLAHVVGGDEIRLRVVQAHSHVQGIVVVENVDLGALGRLRVLDGQRLMQIVNVCGAFPDRVAEVAIDDGRGVRAHDAHAFLTGIGQYLLRPQRYGKQAKRHSRKRNAH